LSLCYKTTRDAIFAMNANLKEGNDKETINLSLQSQTYFEREREREREFLKYFYLKIY
jgi:hypothetical protein